MLYEKEGEILKHLLRGAKCARELINAAKEQIKPGTLHPTIARMEKKGYVKSTPEPPRPGGGPRRKYTVTEFGRRVYDARESHRSMLNQMLAAVGFIPSSRMRPK
jgi:DNA-binding PadR family transcriptional regulator